MAGKTRSPNYPAVNLGTALESAAKLWSSNRRAPMSHDAAATALGYKSLSGPARVAIAALRQYGLVDKADKGHVRLSDLAVRALMGNTDDKQAALQQAAGNPTLFKELSREHADASEATIRSYLITRKGFIEDGARRAGKAFKETLKLAKPDASGYTEPANEQEPEDMAGIETGQFARSDGGKNAPATPLATAPGVFSMNVPFSKGSISVQVRVTGDTLKPAHLARVRKYLELAEADFEADE